MRPANTVGLHGKQRYYMMIGLKRTRC